MRKFLFFVCMMLCVVSNARGKFVVVQIADAQLGFKAAEDARKSGEAYINDLSYEAEYLDKAVKYVNETKPDVVVFTGDQVNKAWDKEQWEMFDRIISQIDKSVDVLHLPGNHDVPVNAGKVNVKTFTERYGADRFHYKSSGVSLIGINTNLIKFDDPAQQQQFEWLEGLADDVKKSKAILVFGHHPFFMKNAFEADGYFQLQKAKRHSYFDLFKKMGVKAVYAGHRHDNAEGEYLGIPMKTTTSSAFQLGKGKPSVRVIIVEDGEVSDTLHAL